VFRIQQASKVPAECIRMNHDLVRKGTFNIQDVDQLLRRPVRCPFVVIAVSLQFTFSGYYKLEQGRPSLLAFRVSQPVCPSQWHTGIYAVLWTMLRCASCTFLLHICAIGPILCGIQVDVAHLRRVTFYSCGAVQA
jgi:hypothetical protein